MLLRLLVNVFEMDVIPGTNMKPEAEVKKSVAKLYPEGIRSSRDSAGSK